MSDIYAQMNLQTILNMYMFEVRTRRDIGIQKCHETVLKMKLKVLERPPTLQVPPNFHFQENRKSEPKLVLM